MTDSIAMIVIGLILGGAGYGTWKTTKDGGCAGCSGCQCSDKKSCKK